MPATRNLMATVMFVVFALTDWLDGWLARKLNQTSAFGAFLDPVADKFLVCARCWCWCTCSRVDVLVALVIIGREIAISALREWMAQIGASRSVAVHMLGKLKTVPRRWWPSRSCCTTGAVRRDRHPLWGTVADLVAAVLTVWSMVYYLQQGAARDPRQGEMSVAATGRQQALLAPCPGCSC
jgi:cardiolipin synthase